MRSQANSHLAWQVSLCPKNEILFLSVFICANLRPIEFYLAPLPKSTIFTVRMIIIKSIKIDIFLM